MASVSYSGFVRTDDRFYSFGEEWANSVTHAIAAIAATVGLVFLIIEASTNGSVLNVVTVSIFGSTLIALYLISTLYHAIPHIKTKRVLQILDHSVIFIVIAGSYTVFTLNPLDNWIGYTICSLVWGIAIFGVVFQPWLLKKGDKLNTILYLIQGWCLLFAARPIIEAMPTVGLVLLFIGGLLYSLGTIFFNWQKLPYHHAIWHLFVLGGSITHYFAVYYTF